MRTRGANEGGLAPPPAGVRGGYFGKYELCARLGRGGQAEVYLALMHGPAGFNKLVVIKELRASDGDDHTRVSRFLDEARLAARLNHPNIVHTYEVGEDDGEYFIAMEFLEGQPLSRVSHNPEARKQFTPAMWARVCAEALRGLGYAHNLTDYDGTPLGIVHRDVAPDNMFLTYDGEVKLVDFGIAKALLNSEQTATGMLKGKIGFMAPEQVRGMADRRSDLFSMGVTLWGFLAGKKLFEGARRSVLYRLMTEPIPGLATELPDVDPMLAAIVDRALQNDPNDRFQTSEEMREALEEFIRQSGDLVPDVRLGKVVREAFAETRQRMQKQIQASISRAVNPMQFDDQRLGTSVPQAPLPEIGSVTPQSDLGSPQSMRSTGSRRMQMSYVGTLPPPPDPDLSPVPQLRRPRLFWIGALGMVAVAIAIAVIISVTGGPRSPDAKTTLAPVEINSDPPGARVELNGVTLGQTPSRVTLAPGPQTLTVTLDAYETKSVVVEATASPASYFVVLQAKAVPPAPAAHRTVPKPSEPGTATEVRATTDAVKASEPPPVAPPPSPPQHAPAPPPRTRVVQPVRPPVASPSATTKTTKETGPSNPVPSSPRVKVIEEDPKAKIEVIKD